MNNQTNVSANDRFTRMRRRCLRTLTLIVAAVLAACSPGENNASEITEALHACELLTAAEVSRLTGDAVASSRVGMESAYSGFAMSQCTHSFSGGRSSMTVQVRTVRPGELRSRQANADRARAEEDGTGMSSDIADAIESGTDITGIGNVAYSYEIGGSMHFVAYWRPHYSVWIWTQSKPEDRDRVLQIEKAAAQIVIDKL